jgi:hypothetical protein
MTAISTVLLNKHVPVTWVLAKDRQSCYWDPEYPKLNGKWHFTIKMVFKSLILAILAADLKKNGQHFYNELESQKDMVNGILPSKMVVKSLVLASILYKKMASIFTFLDG